MEVVGVILFTIVSKANNLPSSDVNLDGLGIVTSRHAADLAQDLELVRQDSGLHPGSGYGKGNHFRWTRSTLKGDGCSKSKMKMLSSIEEEEEESCYYG